MTSLLYYLIFGVNSYIVPITKKVLFLYRIGCGGMLAVPFLFKFNHSEESRRLGKDVEGCAVANRVVLNVVVGKYGLVFVFLEFDAIFLTEEQRTGADFEVCVELVELVHQPLLDFPLFCLVREHYGFGEVEEQEDFHKFVRVDRKHRMCERFVGLTVLTENLLVDFVGDAAEFVEGDVDETTVIATAILVSARIGGVFDFLAYLVLHFFGIAAVGL